MADVLGKKISELAETTDFAGLYTIGSDRNNQSKKVPLQFVKEAADYANAQGDYAKGVGDNIQGNTGVNEYPAFSSSTQYAAGSVVRYNNKLYRFTSLHPAGAWVGTDAIETSIKAETDVKLTELESKTSLSALSGIEGKVAMNTDDRLVFFDLTLNEGDMLEWNASDSEGSPMVVSLHYGNEPADYIVINKSPYTIDNAHKYTRLRFYRNKATISEVSYYFKLVPKDAVSKEDISGERLLSFPNNTSVQNGGASPNDTNWISTDFISLEGILSFSYYLASMKTSAAISFYTDKDYATQITSANIMGTTNIGTSGILQGTINKEGFPKDAKYIVFCSVNPASEYYDGEVSVVAKVNMVKENAEQIDNLNQVAMFVKDYAFTFPNNTTINNGGVTPNDSNWISTDFISLDGILSFDYYLASMKNAAAVSFYTEKDYATQITSANIMGTTNVGTSGILQGTINKEGFPKDAKYIVFCSVNPASEYYDGEVKATGKMSQILYNTAKLEEITKDGNMKGAATNVLYSKHFTQGENFNAWVGVSADMVSDNGLQVDTNGCVLSKEYGLAQRILNLRCKFNSDSIVQITSYPTKDSTLVIDCSKKTFNLNGLHEVSMPFFNAQHDYNIEIVRDYQSMKVILTDMISGDVAEYDYINNGTGGVGGGAVGTAYLTGAFHDFYQFATTQGTFYIKDVKVMAFATDYHAIFYGDSITEQDSYFPTSELSKSWVFRALANMKGVASGRGGGNIIGVMSRIKNELPFIKAKYVVVTIGTNGANTISRLSELVEYIQSQGATPILNHIPCNESGTQVSVNAMIDEIRAKYGIKGADFDLCTSINGDGVRVNENLMFWENYSSSNNIYHHPNEKGGATMYCQLRQDVPEIFVA